VVENKIECSIFLSYFTTDVFVTNPYPSQSLVYIIGNDKLENKIVMEEWP
jgi:hypothetical protein